MDITFASLIFASRTIPTDFGLVLQLLQELEVCFSLL